MATFGTRTTRMRSGFSTLQAGRQCRAAPWLSHITMHPSCCRRRHHQLRCCRPRNSLRQTRHPALLPIAHRHRRCLRRHRRCLYCRTCMGSGQRLLMHRHPPSLTRLQRWTLAAHPCTGRKSRLRQRHTPSTSALDSFSATAARTTCGWCRPSARTMRAILLAALSWAACSEVAALTHSISTRR